MLFVYSGKKSKHRMSVNKFGVILILT